MTSPSDLKSTTAQENRYHEKRFFWWLISSVFVGSSVLHGLTISLVYLRPAQVNAVKPPEPELEIVIEEEMFDPEVTEEVKVDDTPTLGGNTGGDESLQVATLAPPQETIAEQLDDQTPPEPQPELTDADLKETPQPQPTPKPKKSPQAEAPDPKKAEDKMIAKGPTNQAGEKNGDPNGSKERGLNLSPSPITKPSPSPITKPSPSPITKPSPSPITKPSPSPITKPSPSPQIAIAPAPKPPEPIKEKPKPKPKNPYGYARKEGERIATGTKAKFSIEYDEKGKVKGGKLSSSTGDLELDAAQLRDFNRALENNKRLRQQLENRDLEKRDRPVRFVFDGEGESAAEREQIQRNRDLTAQQEAQRAVDRATQAEPPAQAAQPADPPPSGLALPLPAPAIDLPPEKPTETPAAPAEAPAATPMPVKPVPAAPIAPIEPAPTEAPAVEPPAPTEAPAVEPSYDLPVEEPIPAPVEPSYDPPVDEAVTPVESPVEEPIPAPLPEPEPLPTSP
ncbi:MAG: hypothetical protein RLZZ511_287 [Cyanobacteriota bacterium]